MTNVTKASKSDPVEALRPEALARTNLNGTDIARASVASNVASINGYPNQAVILQNDVPFVDGEAELSGTEVGSLVIRTMLETLIREYSRVRLIRYVRIGDNFTYSRFGRVNSPDSSTSDFELSDFGIIFPANPIDQSEYLRVVGEAAEVMRANFNNLFAVINYCHASCHTDCHNDCHADCHTDQVFRPDGGDTDGDGGGGGC